MRAGRPSGGHRREPSGVAQGQTARSYLSRAWGRPRKARARPRHGYCGPARAGAGEPAALGHSRPTGRPRLPASVHSPSQGARAWLTRTLRKRRSDARGRLPGTAPCTDAALWKGPHGEGSGGSHSSGLPRNLSRPRGSRAPTPRPALGRKGSGTALPGVSSEPRTLGQVTERPGGAGRALRLRIGERPDPGRSSAAEEHPVLAASTRVPDLHQATRLGPVACGSGADTRDRQRGGAARTNARRKPGYEAPPGSHAAPAPSPPSPPGAGQPLTRRSSGSHSPTGARGPVRPPGRHRVPFCAREDHRPQPNDPRRSAGPLRAETRASPTSDPGGPALPQPDARRAPRRSPADCSPATAPGAPGRRRPPCPRALADSAPIAPRESPQTAAG
ncbi:collagen alpha-1(III) chain-like [Lutra lutra]|uniref:collagen alpha-1(III) chain-like n=1 Tax=Lutra lutra TaxID=9657 RepID=UPI001FD0647B|nr:collagen alpha-1(III) chain-like [Lutra lutra]